MRTELYLGRIVAGPFADRFGVQAWFVAGGVVTAMLGAAAFLVPAIVNIEDRKEMATRDISVLAETQAELCED